MAIDYLDKWELNGAEVLIKDYGRAQANGVATLDENGFIPSNQIPSSFASGIKVSPDAPSNLLLTDWVTQLKNSDIKNVGKIFRASTSSDANFSSSDVKAAVYFKGMIVCVNAISSNKTFYYSEDNGETFTKSTSVYTGTLISDKYPYAMCTDGNVVACCFSDKVMYTEDGKTWHDCIGSAKGRNMLYADGLWITGNTSGNIYWSEDGKTWYAGSGFTGTCLEIAKSPVTWMAVNGSGIIFASTDGKNWAQTATFGASGSSAIDYSEGLWCAALQPTDSSASIRVKVSSNEGQTWSNNITGPAGSSNGVTMVKGLKGKWYIGANYKLWQTDFNTGSAPVFTNVLSGGSIRGLTYSKKLGLYFVIGGSNILVSYSVDGISWESAKGNPTTLHSVNYLWLFEDDKLFAASQGYGTRWSKADVWLPSIF